MFLLYTILSLMIGSAVFGFIFSTNLYDKIPRPYGDSLYMGLGAVVVWPLVVVMWTGCYIGVRLGWLR
jgi:hypothetical protein